MRLPVTATTIIESMRMFATDPRQRAMQSTERTPPVGTLAAGFSRHPHDLAHLFEFTCAHATLRGEPLQFGLALISSVNVNPFGPDLEPVIDVVSFRFFRFQNSTRVKLQSSFKESQRECAADAFGIFFDGDVSKPTSLLFS